LFNKLSREIEAQKDAKFEHNHWEVAVFNCIDNNLVDSVFSNILTLSDEQQNFGMLAEMELIHHI
jgi:hypothetical protein